MVDTYSREVYRVGDREVSSEVLRWVLLFPSLRFADRYVTSSKFDSLLLLLRVLERNGFSTRYSVPTSLCLSLPQCLPLQTFVYLKHHLLQK